MAKHERCVGCGIEADEHPIVGIGQANDDIKDFVISGDTPTERGFVAYGVCMKCHVDPTHRRRQLKMAFFTHDQLATALDRAGSNSINAGGR